MYIFVAEPQIYQLGPKELGEPYALPPFCGYTATEVYPQSWSTPQFFSANICVRGAEPSKRKKKLHFFPSFFYQLFFLDDFFS